MLDPSNIPPVEETEVLSRYVLQSNLFRKSEGTPKPGLFMPHPRQELSVTRHKDATQDELWQVGKDVVKQRGKTLYGRFDIQAKDCQIDSLTVESRPQPNNPNHADIIGWPTSKEEQLALAQEIAARTRGGIISSP
jgi:hypothetical protein